MKMAGTNKLKKALSSNLIVLVIVIVLMCLVLSLSTDYFATTVNATAVLNQVISNGILAVGMTFVLLTGGIDLSVGSLVSFCGVLLASLMNVGGMTLFPAILCTVVAGAVLGSINGILISVGKVPAFIATLGMMNIAAGAALTLSDGRSVTVFSAELLSFMQIKIVEVIPMGFIIMLACFIIGWFVLKYTKIGRYIYIMGGNSQAALLSGINVKKAKIVPFMVSGLCSAIAAIYVVGKLNSANPIAGTGSESDAIAATVIGGVTMSGGEGNIVGTFLGSMIMGIIKNGLVQLGVNIYLQQIVIGALIITVVLFDMVNRRREE